MLKFLDADITTLSLEALVEYADDLTLCAQRAYEQDHMNLFEECAAFLQELEIEIRCREVFSRFV